MSAGDNAQLRSVGSHRETRSVYDMDSEDAPAGARVGDVDDPAIWAHPTDVSRSVVIGVLKDGGLDGLDLRGRVLQTIDREPAKSDGADVVNANLGPELPFGLLVVQDGSNDPALLVEDDGELENVNTNFKFVRWERVAGAFANPLKIDTVGRNPRGGLFSAALDTFNRRDSALAAPWAGAGTSAPTRRPS